MNALHLTLITGSSRGLGAALLAQRLQPGHQVLGIARRQADGMAERAAAQGALLTQWQADLADPLPVAERLAAWLRALDGTRYASVTLINNAGVVGTLAPLHKVTPATLSTALRVGLEATLLLSAAFLDATASWPGARRLMNISSGLGRRAMAGSAVYCAAKAGMDHLSRALALEQAAEANPARVESIAPGIIDTDMQAELRGADPALFPEQSRFAGFKSGGQLATAEDTAARLLARLERPDYGREAVTDIREG